jgi:uncharacterized membrane protein
MFRNKKRMGRWMVIAVAIGLFCSAQGLAKKPVKPYTLVLLPDAEGDTELDGYANAMNELLIEGQLEAVEVVGSLAGHAHHWWLNLEGDVVTTTPLLPTDQVTEARDINDDGVIVGSGDIDGAILPLVWLSLDDEPMGLSVPEGVTGIAVNINNNGMVIGLLKDTATSTEMLAVWQLTEGGTGPTAGPFILSTASTILPTPDLNDAGEVVARVRSGGTFQGQRWSVSWDGEQLTASGPEILTGTMMDENGQPQAVSLEPQAINETGDICGWYGAVEGPWGAFLLLADGTLIDLPPLDSKRYLTRSGNAYDLNDAVDPASIQIVGDVHFFEKRNGREAGTFQTVWQGGNVTDLEADTGQPDSDLRLVGIDRISNHGWLAGYAGEFTAPRAAVIVPK